MFLRLLIGVYIMLKHHLVPVLLKSIDLIAIFHKNKKLLFSRKIFNERD